jgi:hypothetical protein
MPLTPTFTEVSDLLANLPEDIRWAVTHISIPDNGLAIAQALTTGQAISVSDASTKDSFGTAAMVLEDTQPLSASLLSTSPLVLSKMVIPPIVKQQASLALQ